MRSYLNRVLRICAWNIALICLAAAFWGGAGAADYGDEIDVIIPYTHIYDADANRTGDVFTYQIKPMGGAPILKDSEDGIYYFTVTGKPGSNAETGQVDLKAVFPQPGEYRYKVSAVKNSGIEGINYENRTYTVKVYVKNAASGGLMTHLVTAVGDNGRKYGRLQLNPSYEAANVPVRPITTPDGDGGNGDNGNGGNGGNGNNGNGGNGGPAGGNGGGAAPVVPGDGDPVATEDIGENQTPLQEIINNIIPKADPDRDYWALLNLLCAIGTIIAAVIMVARYFGRIDTEEDEYIIRREGRWRLAAILPALIDSVTFLLTEDLRKPMAFTDEWTLFMVIGFALSLAIGLIAYNKYDRGHDEDQGNGMQGETV